MRPATLRAGMVAFGGTALAVGGPGDAGASGKIAVSAGTLAAGTVIQNPYWTGPVGCPGTVGGWKEETPETPAEVIFTAVPLVRKHSPGPLERLTQPDGQAPASPDGCVRMPLTMSGDRKWCG